MTGDAKHLGKDARDDRGSAMIAVIGVMAVLSLVAVTVTTVSVNSLGHTSASRAGVQSVAAAESGVNFARSQVERDIDPCDIDWTAAPTAVPFTAAWSSRLTVSTGIRAQPPPRRNSSASSLPVLLTRRAS